MMSMDASELVRSTRRFADTLPALAKEAMTQWRIANLFRYVEATQDWSTAKYGPLQEQALTEAANLLGLEDMPNAGDLR
jgi:hypothetical protein